MLTDSAKIQKREYQYLAKGEMNKQGLRTFSHDVSVTMFWHPTDNRRRDTSNYVKLLYDSLSGIVYKDDSQIAEEHYYKREKIKGGKVVLIISDIKNKIVKLIDP